MNRHTHIALTIMMLALSSLSIAQTNIVDAIESYRDIDGNSYVTIHQDDQIQRVMNDKILGTHRQTSESQGYRVQVFSSNVPRTAKAEAFKMEKKINDELPQLTTHVIFQPPFWKVRLGDYITSAEAMQVCNEIREIYPDLQGDIYVVRDNIEIVE